MMIKEKFFAAVIAGNIKDVRLCIEQGVDINSVDAKGRTALSIAIEFDYQDIFDLLLEKRASLKKTVGFNQGQKKFLPTFNSRGSVTRIPLSFAQERLWFLEQYEQGKAVAYNMPAAFRLKGTLNQEALKKSLEDIISRHESLRTTFHEKDGEPYQAISPNIEFELPLVDLTALNKTPVQGDGRRRLEQEEEIERLLSEEAHRPFDLKKGPLMRGQLLKIAEDEHIFLLTQHHIISDDWSMGVLFKELSDCYEARVKGEIPQLPPLPIQYADFAISQREWLQGDILKQQVEYWKNRLTGYEDLNLPTDQPRPSLQTFNGSQYTFQLPSELSKSLQQLAIEHQASLFTVLLTAFNILLGRYSGQTDIVVGTPIANRHYPEVEGLIGFFVNTLAMRTQINPEQTFSELLQNVTHHALEAYQYQDVPFENVVDALQVNRDMSRTPLFQAMFVVQNATRSQDLCPPLGNLEVSFVEQDYKKSKFDLTLYIWEKPEGIVGSLEFNIDLFEPRKMLALINHYQSLLQTLVNSPNQKIADITFISKAEYHNLVIEKNKTSFQWDNNSLIHKLFEEQVTATPDSIAIIYGNTHLTYKELNKEANKLAYYLIKQGIRPESPVAICLDRSIELIASILAVLKAGGVYVPIDANYPEDRIKFILDDTNALLLITQRKFKNIFNKYDGNLLLIDEKKYEEGTHSYDNPLVNFNPENLAYIIYTSGSTGKPKGVMCRHSSVGCCVKELQQILHLNNRDRILQHISIGFDVSVEEIFHPLIVGSRLIILPPGLHKDLRELISYAYTHKVSTIHLVPSVLKVILDTIEEEKLINIKKVIMGGEILTPALISHFNKKMDAKLYNGYGPTEAFYTTLWKCDGKKNVEITSIGKPVGNNQMYILDGHLQLVPEGVPGELYISGSHLSRGYYNQPDLTAERFIPHPFTSLPGERLYRTGDIVRWLPDGNLDFLGRLDHQVKIRGYRIELGEIEANLQRHEAIKDVRVVAREDQLGDKRLVVYYIPKEVTKYKEKNGITINALREYLAKSLPDYMIPNSFMSLISFPLTSNGKLNRKALPAPQQNDTVLGNEFVVPRTPVERKLAEIWCEVLKLKKVGVYDNFFSIGGHSLLATKVVSRIFNFYGIHLPIKSIFQTPTIVELAYQIENEFDQAWENGASPLAMAAGHNKSNILLTFIKRGAKIDNEDGYGRTPLLISISQNHEEIVKLLLTSGADINKARKDGTTPLQAAAQKGNIRIVKELLARLPHIGKKQSFYYAKEDIRSLIEKTHDFINYIEQLPSKHPLKEIINKRRYQGKAFYEDLLSKEQIELKNLSHPTAGKFLKHFESNFIFLENDFQSSLILQDEIQPAARGKLQKPTL